MSLLQSARKPTLSAVRSCSRVRYNSNAAPEPKPASSFSSSLFARMQNNASSTTYNGVEVQNIKSPKRLDIGGGNVWKDNGVKLDTSMREPSRPRRNPRPAAAAPQGQAADPDAAARIMSRQPNPFNVRPPRRDEDSRERRAPRDNQRQAAPRDGQRRDRHEGSLNDRVKQAGSERLRQTDASTEQASIEASTDAARERPVRAASKAIPLRLSSFRTAHFGNVFSSPSPDAPATREAEVLRALDVPKEHPETLVVKPRKAEVRVEKGVRRVKKRVVMRGSKRIVVDPRIRPMLERYGGDYTRLAPRSALSGLHKPRKPVAYAKAALTLRPYLSSARRGQALDVVEKFAREARVSA
ncbi:unnamed protein product [Peniophora sp. CBMAI 1063]|nr:unnamed protein product [Peniophora sp. CBMAI 1063]